MRSADDNRWLERRVTVLNKHGLHMRPAQKFVERAKGYGAEIHVAKGEREFDAKSILDMIEFAALMVTGSTDREDDFLIRAKGADADKALDDLERLVRNRFDME